VFLIIDRHFHQRLHSPILLHKNNLKSIFNENGKDSSTNVKFLLAKKKDFSNYLMLTN
jgi:hypothetical protein